MKYRKKPVVVEAEQFNFNQRHPKGVCFCPEDKVPLEPGDVRHFPHIHTLEGLHKVSEGDWIITGIKGERYPCNPDIFEATYAPVEEGKE